MSARFPTFLPLLVLVLLAASAGAGVLHVPADYPTIQAAIDAAHDGDVVLVAAGTYVELVDFEGKAIIVRSELGPDVTTIDGNGLGTTVTFKRSESRASMLGGFTIRGGTGTKIQLDGHEAVVGGGVICLASSPTLENNHIIDSSYLDVGAGLYCGEGSSPLVTGNSISGPPPRQVSRRSPPCARLCSGW